MNEWILSEIVGQVGFITLNRPQALNALSLSMIRSLTAILLAWKSDQRVQVVAIRGSNKNGPFGSFCAGGDIRFFHAAALAGDPALGDFFTEEYTLNHLIHIYPKPTIALMDGIVMGGGMGISQGTSHRLVTGHTKMAMPETNIGLFPDVGGGYFLSRCPGSTGEWLALTGELIGGNSAIELGLADSMVEASRLPALWTALGTAQLDKVSALESLIATFAIPVKPEFMESKSAIDHHFSRGTVIDILESLERDTTDWAKHTVAILRKRSPLMLHVVLEQIRRARGLSLADDLRMERDMVQHCFHTKHLQRQGATSETVEGIRALAIDKDHQPRWNPARIEEVTPDMVTPFFASPWVPAEHPLRALV